MDKILETLYDLGLNRLEAEVYLFLVSSEPSTAYRIGKSINKPTANIYKAIESLAVKGAVMVEDNKSKVCRAVAPDEFIGLYQKDMQLRLDNARALLGSIEPNDTDERSYSIESVPLVFHRFEQMLGRCKSIAVVDAFPMALQRVAHSIEKAARRGVSVFVEAYSPIEIAGAELALVPVGDKALDHWRSQQLNLVIDGEEHLVALMDSELRKVKQAVWSSNTYMSCMLHAGFMREQTLMKIMVELDKPHFDEKVREILNNQLFFHNSNISGFNRLKNR